MTPSVLLLNIIGGVCLLLWGLHNVRYAVQRAFGHNLHEFIASSTKNRFQSCLSGFGITLMLQSSTATALIIAALCGSGLVTFGAGVAIMLGADIGTSLLAYLFSLKITWLSPLLIFVGFVVHSVYQRAGRKKHIGTLIVSLGVMLLALGWIRESTAPLSESEAFPVILDVIERDKIMAVLVAALFTYIAHSSLAIVLLLMSLSMAGLISIPLGIAMVLGANLGGAIAPILATYKDKRAALRVPVANFFMRLTGVVIALPFITQIIVLLEFLSIPPDMSVVATHIGFNVALTILFLPFVNIVANFVTNMLPDKEKGSDPANPQYIDESQLDTPSVALTSAARETLRMADIVGSMLDDTIKALGTNDEAMSYSIRKRDDTVDRLYKDIKLFLARISEQALDSDDSDQYQRIMNFCINLEAAGDVIDKSLVDMALKKIEKRKFFSDNGWKDIQEIHGYVQETMEHAHTVFLNDNEDLARTIIKGKDRMRKAEINATEAHMSRIREGIPESIDTSSLHLDIIRDFRRINSHIANVAYPVLEEGGHLRGKRLKSKKTMAKSN